MTSHLPRFLSRIRRASILLISHPSRFRGIVFQFLRTHVKPLTEKKRLLSYREVHTIFSDRDAIPTRGFCCLLKKDLLDCADTIVAHEVDLLGSGRRSLGSPLPWTVDFKSGHDFGLEESQRIPYGKGDGSDIKVPWELSRFYHAPLLAFAHQESRNSSYLTELLSQLDDWIRMNPLERGPNWVNAMEAGIRAANWCLALECVKNDVTKFADPHAVHRIAQSLYEHALFIEAHLEYGPVISNHYLSDLVGLLYLGVFFRSLPESKRWQTLAIAGLEECMQRQVYDDGVDFEASIPYHRLVTELFGYAALVCRHATTSLSSTYWSKLECMVDFARHYTKPDDHAPQIGDNDNGRLHLLEADSTRWVINDHRHLFRLAELLWPEKQWPERKSILFPCAQIAILRSKRLYAVVDVGPNGQGGNGGHCHNDTLSFELQADAHDIVIDSGTGCYTSDLDMRNDFRSTIMHNTVAVDGEEQNRIPNKEEGVFWMHSDSHPRVVQWETSVKRDLLEAKHDGFRRFAQPVTHIRTFNFDKGSEKLSISDHFEGVGTHQFEWNFHLHPNVVLRMIAKNELELSVDSCTLHFLCDPRVSLTVYPSRYSPSYGIIQSSQSIRLTTSGVSVPASYTCSFTLQK